MQLKQSSTDFLRHTFLLMSMALILTAITAIEVNKIPELHQLIYHYNAKHKEVFTLGGNLAVFSPFLIVCIMSFSAKLSTWAMTAFFIAFSILEGISLSCVFIKYTTESISSVFFVCAIMFLATSFFGYFTKYDLTKVGTFGYMALFGLIAAGIFNIFFYTTLLSLVTSIVGVVIFTGITAYDIQKLKNLESEVDADFQYRLAIYSALTLYLDFVNMFLYLLRIFGKKK